MNEKIFALAWYTKVEYSKFQLLSADPEVWDECYDSWKRNAENTIRNLEADGASVVKVAITFSEIQQWCAMSGKENVSSARSEFAAAKLQSSSDPGA